MSDVAAAPFRLRLLTGFFERMRGLLGRDSLPAGEVWVFPRCRAVHTVGMRFAIDIAFLDRAGRVLSVRPAVRPGRWLVWGGLRARATVESAAGELSGRVAPGDPFPWISHR